MRQITACEFPRLKEGHYTTDQFVVMVQFYLALLLLLLLLLWDCLVIVACDNRI